MVLESIENRNRNIANMNLRQLKKMFSKEKDIFVRKIIILQIIEKGKFNSLDEIELFCSTSQLKQILECSLK